MFQMTGWVQCGQAHDAIGYPLAGRLSYMYVTRAVTMERISLWREVSHITREVIPIGEKGVTRYVTTHFMIYHVSNRHILVFRESYHEGVTQLIYCQPKYMVVQDTVR